MPAKPLNDEQKRDADRLKALFHMRQQADPSLTQEKLAHECGWKTQGAASQYLLGKIPLNLPALLKFSKALHVEPAEISPNLADSLDAVFIKDGMAYVMESKGGSPRKAVQEGQQYGTASLPAEHGNVRVWTEKEELEGEDRVWIDRYDYHFSAGNGSIQWELREKRALPFEASFFRDKGVKPDHCKLLVSRGDSMEPYLFDKNIFMIDCTDHRIRDGEIYAIYYEDEALVKQIFKLPGGGLRLHSFNSMKYPDRDLTGDQLQFVKIVGREFWRAGGR